MTDPDTIRVQTDERGVALLTLNRPDVHNAFDDVLIRAMTQALRELVSDDSVRIIVLSGAGESFSAGADLNWMRRMAQASEDENHRDSLELAALMRALNYLPKPVIARVNGSAFGGGVGLIACCDVAIASRTAKLGLTEARLGLVPAVISPYVIEAIGANHARRLFQTAEVLDADAARDIGLLHHVVDADDLDTAVERQIDLLLAAGPQAVAAAKALVFAVIGGRNENTQKQIDEATARLIARLRVSPEGQEGITAFLEKRQPSWNAG